MKIAGFQIKRRIFVTLGLMVLVTGATYYWNRASQTALPGGRGNAVEAFVKFDGSKGGAGDPLMEEKADYFDPTPLFLPTSRNYGQGALPTAVVKQPGQVFGDFEPKLNLLSGKGLPDYGGGSSPVVSALPDVLARGNDVPFAGFAQDDRDRQFIYARQGFIEVKALKSGIVAVAEPITGKGLPQADYQPIEFIVAIGSEGLIGDPVMVTGSGRDDIDSGVK